MNKITSNLTQSVSQEAIVNILKYYQSTVVVPEFYSEYDYIHKEDYLQKMYDYGYIDYFELPESIIKSVKYSDVGGLEKIVLKTIDHFIVSQKVIYLTLILVVYESQTIEPGLYGIDPRNKLLLKYKLLNNQLYPKDLKSPQICLSYFIDIKKSAFLQDEYGFLEGVMQAGKLMCQLEQLQNNSKVNILYKCGPQQITTHKMGILCREQLFIKNQFFNDRGR